QTFHTPSFGDEEFEIPPINLQNMGGPTAADEAATAEAVYASQVSPDSAATRSIVSPPGLDGAAGSHGPGDGAGWHDGGTHGLPRTPGAPSPRHSRLMGPPSMIPGAPSNGIRTNSNGSGSPPGSNHTSPGQETTSEDSDDSTPLSQLVGGVKRPSPEPLMDNGIGGNGKAVKKPKVPKKKKKRDPNEPQK
ncbi:unnamed protein product, partial [Ixodes persulcatus]